MENEQIIIEDVEKAVGEVYLMKDTGVIRAVLATVVGNLIDPKTPPIWLILLAGSSSGKTIMLNLLNKLENYIMPVDTLTTNTFASGLKRDEETSLLHKANRKILIFKDLTVLTTMNEEGQREIMGQFRAIYDGSFNKKTGNNADIDWKGKIGVLGAGTIAVQMKMRQYAQNGERFLNYIIDIADPREITMRAMMNQKKLALEEERLAIFVAKFVNQILNAAKNKSGEIPQEIMEEMADVADFCTLARSPVIMNKKNVAIVDYVPEREVGPRMGTMLMHMANALMFISRENYLSNENAKILYKIGLDSIPVDRRLILTLLTRYRSSTTKNIAIKLNYTTETVRAWLNQLNALKMVDRRKDGQNDVWTLRKQYKIVMNKYVGIEDLDIDLQVSDDEESGSAYADDSATRYDQAPDPSVHYEKLDTLQQEELDNF